jgi:hypothetical protein
MLQYNITVKLEDTGVEVHKLMPHLDQVFKK